MNTTYRTKGCSFQMITAIQNDFLKVRACELKRSNCTTTTKGKTDQRGADEPNGCQALNSVKHQSSVKKKKKNEVQNISPIKSAIRKSRNSKEPNLSQVQPPEKLRDI